MGLLRRHARAGTLRGASSDDRARLREFAQTRAGVEAYIEPQTTVTATTLVLVAADGEWTRRRIESPAAARTFARKHGIPLYDAGVVGYPRRMREWTSRQQGRTSA